MSLPDQPKSMVVLGAGAIGVEFASFYRSLGTEVTIVEFLPRLVPNEDPEISQGAGARVRQARHQGAGRPQADRREGHRRQGRDHRRAQATAAPRSRSTPTSCSSRSASQANTENLGLEAHGIALERGFIKVDAENRCGDGLWAIGDVIGRGLAHVASAEGVFVAEKIANVHAEPVRYDAIPACTYCSPEIALGRPHRGQGEGRQASRSRSASSRSPRSPRRAPPARPPASSR